MVPGHPEHLAATQPERDHQHERRMQRVLSRHVEEGDSLVDAPRPELTWTRLWHPHQRRHVAGNEVLPHRVLQGVAQDRVHGLHLVRGDTVLAFGVEEASDVGGRQLLQALAAQARCQVEPNERLVLGKRRAADAGLGHLVEPVRQVLVDPLAAGGDRDALVDLAHQRDVLLMCFVVRASVDPLAATLALRGRDPHRRFVSAVLALVDRAGSGGLAALRRCHQAASSSRLRAM